VARDINFKCALPRSGVAPDRVPTGVPIVAEKGAKNVANIAKFYRFGDLAVVPIAIV
jgi:hypothetical protein